MDVRRVLTILNECAAAGTDAYGLAVRVAAEVDSDAVSSVVAAANGAGFSVDVREGASMSEVLVAIVTVMDRRYVERMLNAAGEAGVTARAAVADDASVEETIVAIVDAVTQ